jgi:hypothetical protein
MTAIDLLQTLSRGEDTRRQFKRDATNAGSIKQFRPLAATPEVTPQVKPQSSNQKYLLTAAGRAYAARGDAQ